MFQIIAKQKNEGYCLIDWVAWHRAIGIEKFIIVSNDCNDYSNELLDALSQEINLMNSDVTEEALNGRSVGQRTTEKSDALMKSHSGYFTFNIDVDEFISFRGHKVTTLNSDGYNQNTSYLIPWMNCISDDFLHKTNKPQYEFNNKAITKINKNFPYAKPYNGKSLIFSDGNVGIFNSHHFTVNGKEVISEESSELYIKHCVINSIEEFQLRSDRGDTYTVKKTGENTAIREKNTYKYGPDLFLMYASQELTPNVHSDKRIIEKAAQVRTALLSNPKIKAAQDKIDAYYKRKFAKLKKSYIPSIFRELNIQHIDDLKTKELEKFNTQFFSSKSQKPHDFYVLMSLANLFEKNHEKSRHYATEGLMVYPSFKLLLMAQSSILKNPYYAVP